MSHYSCNRCHRHFSLCECTRKTAAEVAMLSPFRSRNSIRCPACGETWLDDECNYCDEGEHDIQCGECEHDFTVSVRVTLDYTSPPMLKVR